MDRNLTTSYTALQIERDRIASKAHDAWRTREALRRPSWITTARLASGAALVTIGERLQGTPVPSSTLAVEPGL
jgi:hypothetical protein